MTLPGLLSDTGRRGLVANAGLFVAACLLVNGLIFALGWDQSSPAGRAPLIPPGPVVGLVWALLFAALGIAQWACLHDGVSGWRRWLPSMLGLVCLAFPFYTAGLSDQRVGYWGTVATLLAAFGTSALLFRESRLGGLSVTPVVAWTTWVTLVGAVFGRI